MFKNYYETYEKLGEGAFGTVRRCIEKRTREEFAVKIIEKTMGKVDLQNVLYEAEICRKLQHPNIVRLLETFNERDQLYLVFDLVVGGELFHDVTNLQFYSEVLASQCMQEILQAVKFCHKNGVVHRDLKAENILLTSKTKPSSIKIADFGLAVEVRGDERGWFGMAGTPLYMAPEILERYHYGKPVDMWSCGVILYLLLIGDEPFVGRTENDLNKKIKAGVYHYPTSRKDSISAEAKDFVKRMLTLNPDERITASEALKHPWIRQPEVVAPRVHLAKTIGHLKKFNARRKFRGLALAAVAAQKFFKKGSGSSLKNVNRLQDNYGQPGTPMVKRDQDSEAVRKKEIIKLTEQLINACEARDSATVEKLCDTNVTAFGSGKVLLGIDLEHFFTENIPVEGYTEWNTQISKPWVYLLSSKTAYIAYVRSTEYLTYSGRVYLQETDETLVWRKRDGKWKAVHFHSGLTFLFED
ncbi:calcium/calmodulin-dependent protein kinase type II subunit delta-like [Bradysia coprophila]|uniref:calcium/calmodulin-dependent protein kinase type II subunit delta-like n=1 Tax=Bradysia coprophila TaxID=38358 RepID=UPI00187DBDAF|nr:calcium/calmodulin-dependent protein kinase type II subunit delta-like [Bradysia coprophila]